MLKTLGAQIKEFKKDSFLTPVFMILEVLMETVIPLMMASIIDNGVEKGDIHHIYVMGGLMIVRESVSCDARLKKISLTEKAKNMVAKSDADIREMEQLISKGFHKEETEQLKHYLDRIMENIGVAEDCCGRKCKSGAKEQKNHNI